MSSSDEQNPTQPDSPASAPPAAEPGVRPQGMMEGASSNTQEWDVGGVPTREVSVGEGEAPAVVLRSDRSLRPASVQDAGKDVEDPEVSVELEADEELDVDVSGEGSAVGDGVALVAGAAIPTTPSQEKETSPMDVEEGSGEIEIADIEDVVEDAVPRPVNEAELSKPPPVPLDAPAKKIPPVPQAALDSAMREAAEWAEPLSDRPRRKRAKPWYEEVFDEDYLRTLPFMTAEQTLREVNFIHDSLSPPARGAVLDVGCGYGRHGIELAQRGLDVTGIDLSLPLLIRAADESQRRKLKVNFVHADMREMNFDGQFDSAYCMLTSFGYFDEETNLKVASGIYKALKPGGRFLLDALNRDYIVGDLPTRVWWEGDGCVVLEEVDFNFHTSRVGIRRSIVFSDGRQVEQDISVRAYSLHELGRLLRQAGFRVVEVSGGLATRGKFFGATSRNLLVVCEKPPH